MRVPLSWLNDYVDVDLAAADELADRITAAGLEVTTIERLGVAGAELEWQPELAMLAQVLEVERHPDADRLVLARVAYGAENPKVVVTGAPNLMPYVGTGSLEHLGIFSPMILEGAHYLDPYKDGKKTRLKGRSLRGVFNDAMLCSPLELGIGEGREDHEGILLVERDDCPRGSPLSEKLRIGNPLVEVFGDVVLDIDIIPNIARCASIVGVAREVAALSGAELRMPSFEVVMDGDPIDGLIEIRTEEPAVNPRFVAMVIEGVSQGPSPFWMQHRLRLSGQRPINVVVDISNYVMLELGQPNHTFDYDLLRRRADSYAPDGPIELITRMARPKEMLVTLDGIAHELSTTDILVTDPIDALGLGGIMGGHESEIRPETTRVLLEAAAWDNIAIRRTTRQLSISTDAGFRFGRGVHPSQAERGAKRAAELLRCLAGGTVARGLVDHHPRPTPPIVVELEPEYVCRLTGLDLDVATIKELLERLDFGVELRAKGDGDQALLVVTTPDHRLDIEGSHDLVEEVCRMAGYDRIPSTSMRDELPPQRGNPRFEQEEAIKDILVGQGLREVITYRLTTPEADRRAPCLRAETSYVELAKPSTNERAVLRQRLLASVLEIAAANSRHHHEIALFELGDVFPAGDGAQPRQMTELAVVMTGPRRDSHWADTTPPLALDFFDLKGSLEALGDALGIAALTASSLEVDGLRPGRAAGVAAAGGTSLGVFGELHPELVEQHDMRIDEGQPVLVALLDVGALIEAVPAALRIRPQSEYPAIREDLALVVPEEVTAAQVLEQLRSAGGALLRRVELFDVYRGGSLAAGTKSLGYRLELQANDRTLNDRDAARLRRRILARLERELGATLRSSA